MGVRATMDSKQGEQRSVIKFLLLECEKPCHIFKDCRNFFLKPVQPFKAGFQLRKGRPSVRHKPRPGRLAAAVTPYNGG